MIKPSAFIFLFVISVANCQFYYNYEEDRPEEPQTETQNYDPSAYQYNPPSTVNQQFVQPRTTDTEPSNETGQRRTRIRVRSRNYQSEPDYNEPQQQSDHAPAAEPEIDHRAARQERRKVRRRQRQRDYVEPVLPQRVYSPSVFENIGLGEAPRGIYIPQNSFLNVLRNPSRIVEPPRHVSQPVAAVPQTINYIQPSVSYINDPQPRFFVQPPSSEEPKPNLILPVTRPQVEYAVSPAQPTNANHESGTQARAVRTNRRSQSRIRSEPEYAAPPTVDIDSFREYTDDVDRTNVMSQVQYVPVNVRQNTRPQNKRRITNYQESTSAPRVYSPSIFDKISLGEAPSGVYVPEDSLLNILRNPSSGQNLRVSRQEPAQVSPQQPTYAVPDYYEEEIIGEEQYEAPPPPPPPPSRRLTSQRSRQTQPSRLSHRQEYQNAYQTQPSAETVQTSSPRRNQQNNKDLGDFEDFERQRPPTQHRTQSQRRQPQVAAPVASSRSQPQASTSERGQSTFRKAKLAIAELPLDTDDDGIPGEAGVNYPTLHEIPRTTFSCSAQPHNGYYADLETSCQVFHLCQAGGVQDSFLCSNGTIFSQEKFSCQWWYKVNCSDAPKFYAKNDELYKVPEKRERKQN